MLNWILSSLISAIKAPFSIFYGVHLLAVKYLVLIYLENKNDLERGVCEAPSAKFKIWVWASKISIPHLYLFVTSVKKSGSLVSKNIPKILYSWENGEQKATLKENEPNFNSENRKSPILFPWKGLF